MAFAQFLRIGNLSFSGNVNLSTQYSTNVDQTPEDQIDDFEGDLDDLWITYGVSLSVNGSYFPKFSFTGGSSLSFERHFIQDDLDEDEDPALNFNLSTSGSFSRYNYNVSLLRDEELTAEKEEVVDPFRFTTNNVRDRTSTTGFNSGLTWGLKSFTLGLDYTYSEERHTETTEADSDEQSTSFNASFSPKFGRYNPSYSFARTREITVDANGVEDDPGWEDTQSLTMNYTLLTRPSVVVGAGAELEESGGEKGTWEPIYTLSASDSRALAPNLSLNGSVSYSLEEEEEKDDVSLVYNLSLAHQLPNGWSESLTFSLEPVDTLGSSSESEEITQSYVLSQPNFIFKGLSMSLSVQKEISKPKLSDGSLGEEQETLSYTFSLNKSLPSFHRKLSNSMSYSFEREEVKSEDTVSNEHLVTWTMSYAL